MKKVPHQKLKALIYCIHVRLAMPHSTENRHLISIVRKIMRVLIAISAILHLNPKVMYTAMQIGAVKLLIPSCVIYATVNSEARLGLRSTWKSARKIRMKEKKNARMAKVDNTIRKIDVTLNMIKLGKRTRQKYNIKGRGGSKSNLAIKSSSSNKNLARRLLTMNTVKMNVEMDLAAYSISTTDAILVTSNQGMTGKA